MAVFKQVNNSFTKQTIKKLINFDSVMCVVLQALPTSQITLINNLDSSQYDI